MKTLACTLAPLALALAALTPSPAFSQGSLTPPGAPAPTMKTLQQIEPRLDLQNAPASAVTTTNVAYHFIITQPGAYYLSANLGVTKTNGIQINAEGVTLDLNGFEISRASGSGGHGIEIPSTSHRASVRNGSLKGFAYGIRSVASGVSARACAFRDLSVSNCSFAGIFAGEGAVLESCRAHDNSGSFPIYAGPGAALTNCTATGNTAIYGIAAGNGSSFINCVASGNTANYGILAGSGSSLTNCTAHANTSAATASGGIVALPGSSLSNCTASNNTSTAGTPTPATGVGFSLGRGSNIHGSTAAANNGDGIQISSGTVVRDNTCDGNGNGGDGAGVHATGSDNRIEGNNVTGNARGIDVDSTGSLILRNSASGNTINNYEIAASNRYGVILDLTALGSAAATGDSAAGTISTTTNPWANFSY